MTSVPLLWYNGEKNVGDECSPYVVSRFSGLPVHQVCDTDEDHVLAIGSMLKFANRRSHVYGTGLIHPDHGLGSPVRQNVYALRGKLTHSELRRGNVSLGDIPHGDPGVLAPGLLGISKAPTATFPLGIVPHYVDVDTPFFQGLRREEGVQHLDVESGLEKFLRDMSACACVVSSSLHGLIFAEALGIPNTWVVASDRLTGGVFKFHDWFSTTSFPRHRPLAASASLRDVIADACLHGSLIDHRALAEAFPRRFVRRSARAELKPAAVHTGWTGRIGRFFR